MAEHILSPDGKFLWTGSEWIPVPPSSSEETTSSANISLQDSVIGGDINIVQNDTEAITLALVSALGSVGFDGDFPKVHELPDQNKKKLQDILSQIQNMNLSFEPWEDIKVGDAAFVLGDCWVSEECYSKALEKFTRIGDKNGQATALARLSNKTLEDLQPCCIFDQKNISKEHERIAVHNAIEQINRSISLFQEVGNWRSEIETRSLYYKNVIMSLPYEYKVDNTRQQRNQHLQEIVRIHNEHNPAIPLKQYVEALLEWALNLDYQENVDDSGYGFGLEMKLRRLAFEAMDEIRNMGLRTDNSEYDVGDLMELLRTCQLTFESHYCYAINDGEEDPSTIKMIEEDNMWIYRELAKHHLPFFSIRTAYELNDHGWESSDAGVSIEDVWFSVLVPLWLRCLEKLNWSDRYQKTLFKKGYACGTIDTKEIVDQLKLNNAYRGESYDLDELDLKLLTHYNEMYGIGAQYY